MSFFVLFPAGLTTLVGGTAAILVAAAVQLDLVGALQPTEFGAAMYLTGAVLALTSAVWASGALRSLRRWRAPRFGPVATPREPWLARHPWLGTALATGVVDLVLIPIDRSRLLDIPDGIVGAGILTGAVLTEIGLVYGLARAIHLALRGMWRITRRSSFAAGAVTTGSLSAALAAYVFASALVALGTALAGKAPPPPPACRGPALACARELLESAARPRPPASPALPAPDPRDAFSACVEELHGDDPARGNAYRDALGLARARVPDAAEAEDVVQDTLVEVCLAAERLGDVRGYFIRSVVNNAGRAAKRYRRFCSLELEPVDWDVDQCVARTAEQQFIQAELQAAAHDSFCHLDARDRTLIQLRAWKDLPHREIARQLGWEEAAVRQGYRRAVLALREQFSLRCR